jgi:hypothetical protein
VWHNGRLRRRVDPDASWQLARQDHAAVVAERAQYKYERDQAIAQLIELQNAARQGGKPKRNCGYRERDLERAMRMERDPSQPLQ